MAENNDSTTPPHVPRRMFDKVWWSLPLPARFASIEASNAGLSVSVENRKTSGYWEPIPCIVWRGTAEQFTSTGFFANGISAKRASGKWTAIGFLRGCVYPDGDGRFTFVIEGCNYYQKSNFKAGAKKALADAKYLDFRDTVMAGYPMANLAA